MKKYALLAVSCSAFILLSCNGNKKELLQKVRDAEAKLKTSPAINGTNGNAAITAYTDYASHYPDDTLSTAFMFNAAGIASSLGQYNKAVDMYENIRTKYPDSRFVPECLLVEGFIYDNNLNDTARAHAKYQELINKFPGNALSKQAAQAIKLLGKTPDEIGKEFEAKNDSTKKTRS